MQSKFFGRNRSERGDYTRETAIRFVIDRVESTGAATRDDFDVERIVATAREMTSDWNLGAMRADAFWRIAATCIKQ